MKFKDRLIVFGSLGFGLGVIIGTVITAITATVDVNDGSLYMTSPELVQAVGSPLWAFVVQALASGLYGACGWGGAAVYSLEEWSMLKCTVCHYLFVMVGYYLLAFSMHWFTPADSYAIGVMFVYMTLAYILIWLINYLSSKASIKKINRELEQLKSDE